MGEFAGDVLYWMWRWGEITMIVVLYYLSLLAILKSLYSIHCIRVKVPDNQFPGFENDEYRYMIDVITENTK